MRALSPLRPDVSSEKYMVCFVFLENYSTIIIHPSLQISSLTIISSIMGWYGVFVFSSNSLLYTKTNSDLKLLERVHPLSKVVNIYPNKSHEQPCRLHVFLSFGWNMYLWDSQSILSCVLLRDTIIIGLLRGGESKGRGFPNLP